MKLKIGELLMSKGLITEEQLNHALAIQKERGGKLGTNLIELGFVNDHDIANALSEQLRIPSAHLEDFQNIPEKIINALPLEMVQKHKLLPLRFDQQQLWVAISDPWAIKDLHEFSFSNNAKIKILIAPEIWVVAALERYHKIPRKIQSLGALDMEQATGDDAGTPIELDELVEPEELLGILNNDSMNQFLANLVKTGTKEDVVELLLNYLAAVFPYMAAYAVRKERISGWLVRGFPVHNKDFATAVDLSLTDDSPLKTVALSSKPLCLTPTSGQAAQLGFFALHIPANKEVRLYPIPYRGKALIVLAGIPEQEKIELHPQDETAVSMACQKAGMALELLVLRKQLLALPQ